MFKASLATLILLASCSMANSQSVPSLMGARATGLGYTSSTLSDEWSLFNNVGGLSKIASTTTGFSYDSRPALIGADRVAFVISSPVKIGTAALGVFHFGNELYTEQIISAGYANSFGLASLGLKLNYIQYRAEGFGSKGIFSLNFGGIAQLTPALSVGVYITNLNQTNISSSGKGKEHLPTTLTTGLGLKASDKIFITTEFEKDLNYKGIWKTGLEYSAHKKLVFRTGFNLNPNAGYFGIGFKPKKFTLDYAFRYEPNLGGSHQATIGYIIKTK